MWPWRRRVETVLASTAGDDATAALTMILRYYRRPVSIDDVRQAIYQDHTGVLDAQQVVTAAERFRMRARGIFMEDATLLARIPTPNIAHVMPDRGEFPRHLDAGLDGYFVVVASTSLRHVRWIDPYIGQLDDQPTEFLALASGVFLLFHEAAAPAPTLR
jgi:ABC-type bacteriocin/lantibiotic exporter with double-glycine peptidase domain